MRKIISIWLMIIILASCWANAIEETKIIEKDIEKQTYEVWLKENNFINIYWNIVNSTTKIINPNISGKISYLFCEPWTKVSKNTLIASIEPNFDWQIYQNNSIQANTIINQIQKLNEIKEITKQNFESQKRQIELKKDELENSEKNIFENIWDEKSWLKNQIKIIDESINLLEKNKKEAEEDIKNQEINLKKNIYNTILKSSKKLDETFWISDKTSNSSYENYLWAKNNLLKEEVKNKAKEIIKFTSKNNESLDKLTQEDISKKLDNFSNILKDASDVVKDSLATNWTFNQVFIDSLFAELLNYSDGLINFKNNLEKLENSKKSVKTNFEIRLKDLEAKKSSLFSEETNLENKKDNINISGKNINEQLINLEETKKAKLKEIDLQILQAEQNLKSVWISLKSENLYAETSGIIKTKIIKADWSQVQVWSPICEIIPDKNSLKLEIYSPERLKIWDKFNYYKNSKQIWNWEIIAEYPEKNPQTQNFIYEWKINFWELKQWEYLDIKILKQSKEDEIWIDLKYISPKLDWYYVNKIIDWKTVEQKVEIWNMNNWEIKIISGLEKWDILEK